MPSSRGNRLHSLREEDDRENDENEAEDSTADDHGLYDRASPVQVPTYGKLSLVAA